jgi:hypothetical protein
MGGNLVPPNEDKDEVAAELSKYNSQFLTGSLSCSVLL